VLFSSKERKRGTFLPQITQINANEKIKAYSGKEQEIEKKRDFTTEELFTTKSLSTQSKNEKSLFRQRTRDRKEKRFYHRRTFLPQITQINTNETRRAYSGKEQEIEKRTQNGTRNGTQFLPKNPPRRTVLSLFFLLFA
jgi:hypothetical protein